MKFHEASNVTLMMLFGIGLYLPSARKLVKNEHAIRFSRICGYIWLIAFPVYCIELSLPVVSPNIPTTERVFIILAGTSTMSITFKLYSFLYNVSRFESLIKIWDEFNEKDFYPQLRKELLRERKKTTDRWSIGFGCILICAFTSTSLIPLYTRKLEHPTVIPYSGNSPNFEILVVYELIVVVAMCFFVHSYNCFLMQIVAFEDVLCNYLSQSLKIILTTLNVTEGGKVFLKKKNHSIQDASISSEEKHLMSYREICREAENNLRIWIKLHQILLRFHDLTKEIYGIPLCVEFFGLVLIICLVVYMMASEPLTPILISNFIVFCFNIYTIFYVTCFYGDLTELSSESLFRECFGDNWFLYSRKIRVAYHFIIVRCSRPLNLMAFNLYPLNSRSFARIFRHSYSFLMFLLQVTRSKQDSAKPF